MPFDTGRGDAFTAPRRSQCPSVLPGRNLIPDPTHKTRIIVRKSGVEMGPLGLARPIFSPRRRHDRRRHPAKKPLFSNKNEPRIEMGGAVDHGFCGGAPGPPPSGPRPFVLAPGPATDPGHTCGAEP